MSPGGEPERDDSGLPPVDIEIPDDARELDRDVQAYYRELKASRRQLRSRRVHRLLSRDGMVLPLLISCLIFALITGTLLTLFTATSIDQGLPGSNSGTGNNQTSPPSVVLVPSLQTAVVEVSGHAYAISQLRRAILLLVPATCSCTAAVGKLAGVAHTRNAAAYLVSTSSGLEQAEVAVKSLGPGVKAADDVHGTLNRTFPKNGLVAVLVAPDGSVRYAQQLQSRSDYTSILRQAHL